MEEFKIIKDKMKEAILLDPVIQEHYIRIYLEELEKCNSMDEIPDDLKRYVKMVPVEMQEEKEDIEVQERETEIEKQELGIDNGKGIIENSIDKLNNAIDNIDSIDENSLRAKNNDDLSISDVQYLMGHSDKATTFHYMHKDTNNIINAVSVFEIFDKKSEFSVSMPSISSIITNRTDIVDANVLMKDMSIILEKEVNLFNVSDYFIKCKEKLLYYNPDFRNI